MIELTSTPMIIVAILGTIGLILPLIHIAKKERGSNAFYATIAFGALIASIGVVIFKILTDRVLPSALFSEDVLVDDTFGGFFAISLIIVAIFTTVGS